MVELNDEQSVCEVQNVQFMSRIVYNELHTKMLIRQNLIILSIHAHPNNGVYTQVKILLCTRCCRILRCIQSPSEFLSLIHLQWILTKSWWGLVIVSSTHAITLNQFVRIVLKNGTQIVLVPTNLTDRYNSKDRLESLD